MLIRFILICVFLCMAIILTPNQCVAQIDSTYISFFRQNFSILSFVSNQYLNLTRSYHDKGGTSFSLYPNVPVNLGLGFTYKNIGISGSIGFPFLRDRSRPPTRSFDFQYHYHSSKLVVDMFVQKYSEYYKVLKGFKDDNFISAKDVKISQYGAYCMYVFNNRKYSHKAAYNLSEKQIKSAGSVLLGGSLFQCQIKSDSTLTLSDKLLNNLQLGISGGYTYTLVFKSNFFITGSMALGFNIGADNIGRLGKNARVYPSFFPKGSAGYHSDSWSIGVSIFTNKISVQFTNEASTILGSGIAQLTYTQRLNSYPKILDKLHKRIVK